MIMDASANKYFSRIFLVLLIVGLIVNTYIFFHPFNTIADEEEYLQEAFSLAGGQPSGWNLRSFVPQLILFLPALFGKFLGITNPELLTLGVRIINWVYWWVGLLLVYKLGKRTFDTPTALIAIVVLSLNWVWMLNSRRVMMDVPSAVWTVAAIYMMTLSTKSVWHCIAIVIAAGMASATKFQMGPLAVFLIVIYSIELVRLKDWKNLAAILVTSSLFTFVFGLTDRLVYGQWFESLFNFYNYTFVNTADFSSTYGTCEPSVFYLTESRHIFSYIFPIFIIFGIASLLVSRKCKGQSLIVIAIVAYLVLIQNVCHKQVRYIIGILPLLTLVGSHGVLQFIKIFQRAFVNISGIQLITALGLSSMTIIIAASMVPRNEISNLITRKETCSNFIYTSVRPELLTGEFHSVLLAVPCGMPAYLLRPLTPIYAGNGFNEMSRKKELGEYRISLKTIRAVVVERGSLMEEILLEEWDALVFLIKFSKYNQYALYIQL